MKKSIVLGLVIISMLIFSAVTFAVNHPDQSKVDFKGVLKFDLKWTVEPRLYFQVTVHDANPEHANPYTFALEQSAKKDKQKANVIFPTHTPNWNFNNPDKETRVRFAMKLASNDDWHLSLDYDNVLTGPKEKVDVYHYDLQDEAWDNDGTDGIHDVPGVYNYDWYLKIPFSNWSTYAGVYKSEKNTCKITIYQL